MTNDLFLTLLSQSKLLPEDVLDKLQRLVDATPDAYSPAAIARKLVDKGQLTIWQARQLLAGQGTFYLGRYQLVDCIGRGGMGVVFKARHAMMGRTVALKVMSPSLLKKPVAVARFNREVKTAAALSHSNIIAAYDADCVGNVHFLVMEFVEGRDLNYWLRKAGKFPISVACECAMQVAEGLSYASRQGMVHRDIKPVNLLVTWPTGADRPTIKILDMGLARFVSEAREDGGLTRLGQTIGTPDYIAPEAAKSFKDADTRADIFSLGCGLFKMLTARLPFDGENTMVKLMARATEDAPPVRSFRKEIPDQLEDIVARMLARDPADRYQSPGEVAEALRPYAASTRGELHLLEVFRHAPPASPDKPDAQIEPDTDSRLLDFFRDIGLTGPDGQPADDDLTPPPAAKRSDDDLGFADGTDEIRIKAATAAATAPELAPPSRSKAKDKESSRGGSRPQAKPAAAKAGAGAEVLSLDDVVDHDVLDEADVVGTRGPSGFGELLADPMSTAATDPLNRAAAAVTRGARRTEKKPVEKKTNWGSILMLFGGGSLLLMVILGGALVWALNRGSGDDLFKAAESDYAAGAYAEAIKKYDQFLDEHSGHDSAGTVRIHRALAKLRQQVEGSSKWPETFEAAKRTIDEISVEDEFPQNKGELAALLPRIAQGLAGQAREQHDPKLVTTTEECLALIDKHVIKDQRPEQDLKVIRQLLSLTTHEIGQSGRLKQTLAEMAQATAAGKTQTVYDLRRRLLSDYPDLLGDAELTKAMQAASAAELSAVTVDAKEQQAQTSEPASTVTSSTALAVRGQGQVSDVAGKSFFTLVNGAAYGLDAATGSVLWRRYVGHNAPSLPRPLSAPAAGDVLAVDAVKNEVLRLGGTDGALRWRFEVGEPLVAEPVVHSRAKRFLVATQSGRLLKIDVETGASSGFTLLPQPLNVGPAIDPREQHYYQIADRSNLFVLSAETGACEDVVYLGHESSTIKVAPLAVDRYLIVAENHLAEDSRLRVFVADEQGLALKEQAAIPLIGHVYAPPILENRTLLVTTDRGSIYAFDISTVEEAAALKPVAGRPAIDGPRMVQQAMLRGGQVWVAGNELAKFQFQAARGRLEPERVHDDDRGDSFLGPLALEGSALFHVRRDAAVGGWLASAVDAKSGARLWETLLGAPLAGGPIVDPNGGRVVAISANGAVFEIDAESLAQSRAIDRPTAAILPQPALDENSTLLAIAGGASVVTPRLGEQRMLLYDPAATTRVRQVELPSPLSSPPMGFGDGVLCPSRLGQVFWLDPRSGRDLSQPFQPVLEAGQELNWRGPLSTAGTEIALTDGRGKLYRVGLVAQPQPHLAALAEVDLVTPLVSPLAVAGNVVYGVDARGGMHSYDLPDLTPGRESSIGASAAWGPERVGDVVLVSNAKQELFCFGPEQQPVWAAPVALPAPLAGRPLAVEGGFVVATVSGDVLRIAADTGEVVAKLAIGEPLFGAPALLDGGLLVSGYDGTLLTVPLP